MMRIDAAYSGELAEIECFEIGGVCVAGEYFFLVEFGFHGWLVSPRRKAVSERTQGGEYARTVAVESDPVKHAFASEHERGEPLVVDRRPGFAAVKGSVKVAAG